MKPGARDVVRGRFLEAELMGGPGNGLWLQWEGGESPSLYRMRHQPLDCNKVLYFAWTCNEPGIFPHGLCDPHM